MKNLLSTCSTTELSTVPATEPSEILDKNIEFITLLPNKAIVIDTRILKVLDYKGIDLIVSTHPTFEGYRAGRFGGKLKVYRIHQ